MNRVSHDEDPERDAIIRDRDLALELLQAQPTHKKVGTLARSVLARDRSLTEMQLILALHREACGEIDEARRLLHGLLGHRDRDFLNAMKSLRDLEQAEGKILEALRLTEIVLHEDP